MAKIIKQLNLHYYIHIFILGILFIVAFLNPGELFQPILIPGVATEMYVIGLTLLVIPLALKMFADRVKKIPKEADNVKSVHSYKSAFLLRLYIVSFATLVNIILYAFSRNTNFMWLTVVLFVVFAFCRTSQSELESITEVEKNENNG